ncbi:MAG: DUF1338 domain-containing protein [Salinivirgaceae bacterium]|nr:DUF1338 domain-containing protein [Salinivirgaceae bacterium]
MTRELLFEKLWKNYTDQNPSVQKVYNSFTELNETVLNDHIAFRTFNDPRMNISVLEKPFLEAGYVEKGQYNFEAKKLFAKHYEVPGKPEEPKVFISQLLVEEFSEELQKLIKERINSINNITYQNKDLIFKGNVWGKPSYTVYNRLREESEYAAWLYVYGFCSNHFTVSINSLKTLNSIEKVNQHLKDKGFKMNTSGGEIKGTKEELLQQSSIMAEKVQIEFTEGTYEIPACYYEFAIRYEDKTGKLYNGFIAKSADKIFESTNFYKK